MKISCSTAFAVIASVGGSGVAAQDSSLLRALRHLQEGQQPAQDAAATGESKKWWDFELGDEVLNEVALFYLGHAWDQSADVSEILKTMHRTNSSDPSSWFNEFLALAERLDALASEAEDAGNDISAGQASLRAATYYRAALHRHPDPFAQEVVDVSQKAVDAFESFLRLTDFPCESVRFPYEGDTTLPAYLCLNPNVDGPAPTIIFNEGKDGWAEDGKYIVDEAMKRGYHAFLWDGPGMGKVIRLEGLPFRHDWENVITPLIDYLDTIPEVDMDNLALFSLSLGGYLAPRAAVYEHRLKALVPNPGVTNWFKVYADVLNSFAPGLTDLVHSNPAEFDATMNAMIAQSDFLHWGMVDSMWHHGVDTPSALMLEIEKYQNTDEMIQKITTPTLVMDAEEEERGQALELYNALPEDLDKKYILFTREEAAELHVQPGATGILQMRVFDWLDGVFDVKQMEKVDTEAGNDSSGAVGPATSWTFMMLIVGMAGAWASYLFG